MIQRTKTQKALDVSVAEALTLLMIVNAFDYDRLNCQFNVANHALDQFVIKATVHATAPLQTLYSSSDSYTIPSGLLQVCSGDLTTVAAAGVGGFILDIGGYHEVRIYAASSNVAGSVVDIYAGLR